MKSVRRSSSIVRAGRSEISNDSGLQGDRSASNVLETLVGDGIGRPELLFKSDRSHIKLSKANIGDQGAIILAKSIKNSDFVEEVDVRGNSLSPVGISALVRALTSTSIKRLDLGANDRMQGNRLGDTGGAAVKKLLEKNVLEHLSMARMGHQGYSEAFEGLALATNLKTLDVRESKISGSTVAKLVRCVVGTDDSEGGNADTLSGTKAMVNEEAVVLTDSAKSGDGTGKSVCFQVPNGTSNDHSDGKSVTYDDDSDTDEGRDNEGESRHQLEELNLSGITLQLTGMTAIAHLIRKAPCLTTLNLSNCYKPTKKKDFRLMDYWATLRSAVSSAASLATLILDGSNLDRDGVDFLKCLHTSKNLAHISLNSCSLRDGSAIAALLAACHTLTRISVKGNLLKDRGISDIARALSTRSELNTQQNTDKNGIVHRRQFPRLQVLVISNNMMTDVGAVALVEMLKVNENLTQLDMGRSELSNTLGASLLALCRNRVNTTLRKLTISHTMIMPSLMDQIDASIKYNNEVAQAAEVKRLSKEYDKLRKDIMGREDCSAQLKVTKVVYDRNNATLSALKDWKDGHLSETAILEDELKQLQDENSADKGRYNRYFRLLSRALKKAQRQRTMRVMVYNWKRFRCEQDNQIATESYERTRETVKHHRRRNAKDYSIYNKWKFSLQKVEDERNQTRKELLPILKLYNLTERLLIGTFANAMKNFDEFLRVEFKDQPKKILQKWGKSKIDSFKSWYKTLLVQIRIEQAKQIQDRYNKRRTSISEMSNADAAAAATAAFLAANTATNGETADSSPLASISPVGEKFAPFLSPSSKKRTRKSIAGLKSPTAATRRQGRRGSMPLIINPIVDPSNLPTPSSPSLNLLSPKLMGRNHGSPHGADYSVSPKKAAKMRRGRRGSMPMIINDPGSDNPCVEEGKSAAELEEEARALDLLRQFQLQKEKQEQEKRQRALKKWAILRSSLQLLELPEESQCPGFRPRNMGTVMWYNTLNAVKPDFLRLIKANLRNKFWNVKARVMYEYTLTDKIHTHTTTVRPSADLFSLVAFDYQRRKAQESEMMKCHHFASLQEEEELAKKKNNSLGRSLGRGDKRSSSNKNNSMRRRSTLANPNTINRPHVIRPLFKDLSVAFSHTTCDVEIIVCIAKGVHRKKESNLSKSPMFANSSNRIPPSKRGFDDAGELIKSPMLATRSLRATSKGFELTKKRDRKMEYVQKRMQSKSGSDKGTATTKQRKFSISYDAHDATSNHEAEDDYEDYDDDSDHVEQNFEFEVERVIEHERAVIRPKHSDWGSVNVQSRGNTVMQEVQKLLAKEIGCEPQDILYLLKVGSGRIPSVAPHTMAMESPRMLSPRAQDIDEQIKGIYLKGFLDEENIDRLVLQDRRRGRSNMVGDSPSFSPSDILRGLNSTNKSKDKSLTTNWNDYMHTNEAPPIVLADSISDCNDGQVDDSERPQKEMPSKSQIFAARRRRGSIFDFAVMRKAATGDPQEEPSLPTDTATNASCSKSGVSVSSGVKGSAEKPSGGFSCLAKLRSTDSQLLALQPRVMHAGTDPSAPISPAAPAVPVSGTVAAASPSSSSIPKGMRGMRRRGSIIEHMSSVDKYADAFDATMENFRKINAMMDMKFAGGASSSPIKLTPLLVDDSDESSGGKAAATGSPGLSIIIDSSATAAMSPRSAALAATAMLGAGTGPPRSRDRSRLAMMADTDFESASEDEPDNDENVARQMNEYTLSYIDSPKSFKNSLNPSKGQKRAKRRASKVSKAAGVAKTNAAKSKRRSLLSKKLSVSKDAGGSKRKMKRGGSRLNAISSTSSLASAVKSSGASAITRKSLVKPNARNHQSLSSLSLGTSPGKKKGRGMKVTKRKKSVLKNSRSSTSTKLMALPFTPSTIAEMPEVSLPSSSSSSFPSRPSSAARLKALSHTSSASLLVAAATGKMHSSRDSRLNLEKSKRENFLKPL